MHSLLDNWIFPSSLFVVFFSCNAPHSPQGSLLIYITFESLGWEFSLHCRQNFFSFQKPPCWCSCCKHPVCSLYQDMTTRYIDFSSKAKKGSFPKHLFPHTSSLTFHWCPDNSFGDHTVNQLSEIT